MLRATLRYCLAAALCLTPFSNLRAEPLTERRSDRYYYLHSGLSVAALLATATEEIIATHHGAGYDLKAFWPDDSVRRNFSDAAADMSDRVLTLNVTAPLLLQMSEGFDTRMGNVATIYGEALSFNLLAANTVKILVRRPRPYTHSKDPRILRFMDRQGSDAFASFYSAHSSTSFTAASAGSLLYAAQTNELAARHTVWGLSFLLAGMTAQLRVSAGRHYRTDIWTGALVGIAIGTVVPALHGVELRRVRGSELAMAAGAFGVSMLLSEAVDFCSFLDKLHLCALPRDVQEPLKDASLGPRWVLSPRAYVGGGGLSIDGEL